MPSAPTPGAPNFVQITHDYGPAVVNISISGTRKVSDDDDDPFAQFFGQIPGARGGMPSRAVSYTHLDVYKRQVQLFLELGAREDHAGAGDQRFQHRPFARGQRHGLSLIHISAAR